MIILYKNQYFYKILNNYATNKINSYATNKNTPHSNNVLSGVYMLTFLYI